MLSDADLVKEALSARAASHSPYSGFAVGAALMTADGEIFTGANIENASFGLSICAERVAIFKAVSEGRREFSAIAVACSTAGPCLPCGACLQVMAEFAADLRVVVSDESGSFQVTSLKKLLTRPFTGGNIDAGRLDRL